MPMRILSFRTLQGLCNRIRGLMCAVGAAEATGRELRVSWEPSQTCGALISDLWEHPFRMNGWVAARALLRISGGLHPERVEGPHRIVSAATGHHWALALQPRPWIENYRLLRIRPDLQARIDGVTERFGARPVVGVSVRAHPTAAHQKSLALSPAAWYEQRLEQIVQQHPGVALFVSSDDPDLAQVWERRWPGDVFTLPDKGAYASVRGLQDALCDLHLLAGSAYILGAVMSSLSETAGLLRGGDVLEDATHVPSVSVAEALGQRPVWQPST